LHVPTTEYRVAAVRPPASLPITPLPPTFTAATRTPPTADEVAPWAAALTRLWDDDGEYREASEKAKRWAERWESDAVVKMWEEFLAGIG